MHYFVSDIHLGAGDYAEQRMVEQRFLNFLKDIEKDADSLFLVGDIFDFWFEYREVVPKGFTRTLAHLAELAERGVRIVMFTGNHDMWIGNYLSKECGIELYTKPQIFDLAGKRLFVAHGDNMNIANQPVLRLMNKMFRSKSLRWLASWCIHPDHFMRFGKWWSGKSRKSHGTERRREVIEPIIEYASQHHNEIGADYYIFGHMHYAADIQGEPHTLFMGDWHTQPSYISLDNSGKIELNIIKS